MFSKKINLPYLVLLIALYSWLTLSSALADEPVDMATKVDYTQSPDFMGVYHTRYYWYAGYDNDKEYVIDEDGIVYLYQPDAYAQYVYAPDHNRYMVQPYVAPSKIVQPHQPCSTNCYQKHYYVLPAPCYGYCYPIPYYSGSGQYPYYKDGYGYPYPTPYGYQGPYQYPHYDGRYDQFSYDNEDSYQAPYHSPQPDSYYHNEYPDQYSVN